MTKPIESLLAPLVTPARSCAQAPFWFWNGPLDPAEMRRQLRLMAEQRVYWAMPHPRFGMDRRDYLEPAYWKAMDATIAEAQANGQQILLYDEYNWPSGGAGGRITDGRADLYPRGLDYAVRDVTQANPGELTLDGFIAGEPESGEFERVVGAFLVPPGCPQTMREISADGAAAEATPCIATPWGQVTVDGRGIRGHLPPGRHRVLVFFLAFCHHPSPLDPGACSFVDFMNPDTTARFIRFTHEAYRERYAGQFGKDKTIPAIFTDEPSTISAGPFPWTQDFAAEFLRRRGYDLLPHLPALCDDRIAAGWQHRAAYWQTVAELFEERFIGRLGAWCREAGIALTGHIFDENLCMWPAAPHLMNWLRHFDWPGFDALGPRATAAGCKIPASVAHLENKPHLLCEALGLAQGWNATLAMAKRGYQYLAVMGVDVLVPHAFFQTTENRRVECPPSYFFQNPYWKYYGHLADLTARLCAFNRQGRHVAPVALFYPIESLWADGTGGRGQGGKPWEVRATGNAWATRTVRTFNAVLERLSAGPYDCDVVDAEALRKARVVSATGELEIGPERFSCLIFPAVRTIPGDLLPKLMEFARAGGRVLFLACVPERYWPAPAGPAPELWRELHQAGGSGRVRQFATLDELESFLENDTASTLHFPDGRPTGIFVMARRAESASFWLLVNDTVEAHTFTVEIADAACPPGAVDFHILDPETGKTSRLPVEPASGRSRFQLSLGHTAARIIFAGHCGVMPATGSHLQPEDAAAVKSQASPAMTCEVRELRAWQFQIMPDAAATDWFPATGGQPVWCELPAWRMRPRAWEAVRGWEQSGFNDHDWPLVAALRGEAQSAAETVLLRTSLPPGARSLRLPLPVTGEYVLYVNGMQVEKRLGPPPPAGERRLDPWTSGVGDILALEVGSESDWAGLTAPLQVLCAPVQLDSLRHWDALGIGWYTGHASYATTLRLDETPRRAILDLGEVRHYAEIWVNGHLAAHSLWPPYRAEIAPFLKLGDNQLTVVVANSVANRFVWDRGSESRSGASWGVPPQPESSGLTGPVHLELG